jgi:alpha-amylase
MKLHHLLRAGLVAAALGLALPGWGATEQSIASSAILFQGFHWDSANGSWYATLQSKAADLKDLGVTHVWFPPPSDAADAHGYLPRQLNVLSGPYGTEAQLTSAISALKSQGIQSVADIVINHRVGTTGWADFTNPTWDCRAVVSNDEWTGHCGNADTGDGYSAARDLDHTQTFVQNDIKTWLTSRLKADGFTGLRFDFAKGYGASYAGMYHDAVNPSFCVGEIWTNLDLNNVDAHRQQLMNYVDGNGGKCAAFDFTTKGLLNEVLANNDYWRLKDSSGKPAGGIGWWAQKMVTFVDNHDTGPTTSCSSGQNLWPVPCGQVMAGYAYILTHPGIPTVYYPHVYDWNLRTAIKSLIGIRKEQGITSTSSVAIQQAVTGLYAAIIDGKVAVKIGPNDWNPGSGWTLRTSGTNYAVWTIGAGGGSGCSTVPVTFSIANANTVMGQSLYAVGNQTALGSWTPVSGFKLTIQGTGANATWTGTANLAPSTAIQYKYVKYDGSTAVWESNQSTASGNREATTAACGGSTTLNDGSFKF